MNMKTQSAVAKIAEVFGLIRLSVCTLGAGSPTSVDSGYRRQEYLEAFLNERTYKCGLLCLRLTHFLSSSCFFFSSANSADFLQCSPVAPAQLIAQSEHFKIQTQANLSSTCQVTPAGRYFRSITMCMNILFRQYLEPSCRDTRQFPVGVPPVSPHPSI